MSVPVYNPYNPIQSPQAQPNQNAAPAAEQASAPASIPFRIAAKRVELEGNTYSSVALDGTGKFNAPVPVEGFISGFELDVTASGGVNGTKTVTKGEDAPWNAISSLIVTDSHGTQLHTLNGYTAYLLQRYMGGSLFPVESDSQSFTDVSTGASGTGNFDFKLRVPFEYGADGRGCLPNSNDAAAYKIATKFDTATTVYGSSGAGQPGTLPTLGGTIRLLVRIIPPPADIYGRPQVQTPPIYPSYIVSESESPSGTTKAGANSYYLTKKGNVYAMIAMIFRDSTGSRSGAVSGGIYPTTVGLKVDSFSKYTNVSVKALNKRIYEKTGLVVPNGVVLFLFNRTLLEGLVENVDDLLPTLASTSIRFDWNAPTAGGTVEFFHVDIVSPDGGLAVTAG